MVDGIGAEVVAAELRTFLEDPLGGSPAIAVRV
jgi:hypothetical protein